MRAWEGLQRVVAAARRRRVHVGVCNARGGPGASIIRKEAPLNHLIRNALDHGLEMPEERRAAGKTPMGTIRLEARHRAGMLQIGLSDDGRGIDLERLRAKVIERGLTTRAMASRLQMLEAAHVDVHAVAGNDRADLLAVVG